MIQQDLALLRVLNLSGSAQKETELFKMYCNARGMNLNPLDYLADDDKLFLITGRSKDVELLTKKWADKYFPSATLIVTKIADAGNNPLKDWYALQAEGKAKYLNDLKIDVYFEDCPEIASKLRELCPNTKVIKYGSRFSIT